MKKTNWALFWKTLIGAAIGCAFAPEQWRTTVLFVYWFGYLILVELDDLTSRKP